MNTRRGNLRDTQGRAGLRSARPELQSELRGRCQGSCEGHVENGGRAHAGQPSENQTRSAGTIEPDRPSGWPKARARGLWPRVEQEGGAHGFFPSHSRNLSGSCSRPAIVSAAPAKLKPGISEMQIYVPVPVLTYCEKNSFSSARLRKAVRTHDASSHFVPRCPVTTKTASPCYPASPHEPPPPSHPLTRLRSRHRRLLRRALPDGDVPAHRASSS